VFALLDMHRHLAASLPALDGMLRANSGMAPLLGQLQALLRATASAAAVLFAEYADSVARDGNKVLPMDGTVHPLTAQVLSYLKVRHRQRLHLGLSLACVVLRVHHLVSQAEARLRAHRVGTHAVAAVTASGLN
jgi:hypothetical protein